MGLNENKLYKYTVQIAQKEIEAFCGGNIWFLKNCVCAVGPSVADATCCQLSQLKGSNSLTAPSLRALQVALKLISDVKLLVFFFPLLWTEHSLI